MAERFTYDEQAGVYYDEQGDPVPDEALAAFLAALIVGAEARLLVWAERLAAGEAEPLTFREGVHGVLKDLHLAAGALAVGGFALLTTSTLGTIGARLASEGRYLSGLTLDWAQGRLSAAQLVARLGMYAGAGHATHAELRRREMQRIGHTEERNILGAADHCAQCPSETARGWVPLGSLVPIGARTCLSNCRCTIQTRRAPVPAGVAT